MREEMYVFYHNEKNNVLYDMSSMYVCMCIIYIFCDQ